MGARMYQFKQSRKMTKLHFENTAEFEKLFKKKDREVTDAIAQGIYQAVKYQKKTAELFEITFGNAELAYEITLPSTQWEVALESCLDHYRELDESNKAIDVYLLQKEVRKWLS